MLNGLAAASPLWCRQVLLHIRTEKGMGYPPAMGASDKYHGVAKFNVATGKQHKGVSAGWPLKTDRVPYLGAESTDIL